MGAHSPHAQHGPIDGTDLSRVVFQCERLVPILHELQVMAEAHAIELDGQPEPLELDVPGLGRWEQAGALRCFTMRNAGVTGAAVGYAVFLVVRNPFKMSLWQASEMALYLTPAWRGTGYGARFMRWQDRRLEMERPGMLIARHTRAVSDHGALLQRLGYERLETIWTRRTSEHPEPMKEMTHG